MPWATVLDGSARDRAAEMTNAVAEALVACPPGGAEAAPSLHGTLGAALFLTEWGDVSGQRTYVDVGHAILDEAVDAASAERPTIGLYGTPVGVAWVEALLRPGGEEHDVDVFVGNVLGHDNWPWANDVMHGLAGVGAYCLARLPLPSARHSLERIVVHLANAAREDADGVTWAYVPPPDGSFRFNEARPEGHVNLGFAHGVPGIVAFLAAAETAGVAGSRDLLEPAVRYLAAQRLPSGAGSAFPAFVYDDWESSPARLAWCYGDPGVAVALLAAGEALGDDGALALAREVALGCAGRDAEVDATLCHGSAGLGHMFNRLGQALADERLLDLARHWFVETVERHAAGLTVVDRAATKRLLREAGTVSVDAGYGLLFGAAGAGLALASAILDRAPRWDAAMFVQPSSQALDAPGRRLP